MTTAARPRVLVAVGGEGDEEGAEGSDRGEDDADLGRDEKPVILPNGVDVAIATFDACHADDGDDDEDSGEAERASKRQLLRGSYANLPDQVDWDDKN